METTAPVEPHAFEAFLAAHRRLIEAVIGRVCRRHRSLVPDARQEVHLALWRRLRSGPAVIHTVSYVYKVALTSTLGVLRKHREPLEERRRAGSPRGAGALLPQERRCHLRQVLERLSPDHARAVAAYLAGFRHQEIAALFGWSEAAARHRLYGALAAVRGFR